MDRYPAAAVERAMKIQEVILRAMAKHITWWQAAALPIAAALRELLEQRGDRYHWKVNQHEAFKSCADELYKVLAYESRTAKSVNHLASDTELWTQA